MAGRIVGSVSARLELEHSQFTKEIREISKTLTSLKEAMGKFGGSGFSDAIRKATQETKSYNTATKELIEEAKRGATASKEFQNALKTEAEALNNVTSAKRKNAQASNNMGQSVQKTVNAMAKEIQMYGTLLKSINSVGMGYDRYVQQSAKVQAELKKLAEAERRAAKEAREFPKQIAAWKRVESSIHQVSAGFRLLDETVGGVRSKFNTAERTIRNTTNSYRQLREELLQVASAMKTANISYTNPNIARGALLLDQMQSGANSNLNNIYRETAQKNMSTKQQMMAASDWTRRASAEMKNLEASTTAMGNAQLNASSKTRTLQTSLGGLLNLSSRLKAMITMVSSLFVWQFANSLFETTAESVKAKSEMDSLFAQMKLGVSDINVMNNALDETVARFQKMNRYSIGETIASLGVEFNLSTEQMQKALPILSMIQSEYLRAGRTTEEATLAVKDIMQGELLRLSRETGVGKGELKAAGWNEKVQTAEDIDSLLEALKKVGEARHWDTFAAKASSLNDILLITQNRFSEFAADIVSAITPTILSGFNIMVTSIDIAKTAFEDISGSVGKYFGWTNSLPAKIVGVATAFGVLFTALVAHRTGAGLVQIAQMGLRRSIIATVFALEAETVAEHGSLAAILEKITGLEAEKVAEAGSYKILLGKILGLEAEIVAENGLKVALWEKVFAHNAEKLAIDVSTMSTWKYITSLIAAEAATIAFYAVLLVAVAALIAYAAQVDNACQKNKAFNDVVNDGDQLIKDANKRLQNYTDQYARLEQRYNSATGSQKDAIKTQMEHTASLKKAAEEEYNATVAAVEHARAVKAFDDQKTDEAKLEMHNKLKESYKDLTDSEKEAAYHASKLFIDAEAGASNYDKAAQLLVHRYTEDIPKSINATKKKLQELGYTNDEILARLDEKQTIEVDIAYYENQMNTSSDVVDAFRAWLNLQYAQLKNAWVDFWNNANAGDWLGAIGGLFKGTFHFIDNTFFGGFFDELAKDLNQNGGQYIGDMFRSFDIVGAIFEGLKQAVMGANISSDGSFTENLLSVLFGNGGDGFVFGIINHLFGSDGGETLKELIKEKVRTIFKEAFEGAIQWALDNVPFLEDILNWLGVIDSATPTAEEKGNSLGQALSDAITNKVNGTSLDNSVYDVLNSADSMKPIAIAKGQGMGDNYSGGFKNGVAPMSSIMSSECAEIELFLEGKKLAFFLKGAMLGQAVTDGFNSKNAIDHHSPGTMARLIIAETGEIEYALNSSMSSMFVAGQSVGSAIVNGMKSSQSNGMGFNGVNVDSYVSDLSSAMALTQNTATGATNAFVGMDNTVGLTFGNMGNTINTTFSNINANATSSYTKIANTSKTQLGNMQSQTTKNIDAIKTSWNGMQTALIASAENIRSQTGQKISNLEGNMSRFWRKVQNPALLIAGAGSPEIRSRNNTRSIGARRNVAGTIRNGGFYAGGNVGINSSMYPKRSSSKSPDSYPYDVLSCLLSGEPCYAGSWNFNWTPQIKKQLDQWRTHFGAIYDSKLRVGKFENNDFPVRGDTDIARNYIQDAISRTSYEFYYNSKYGSALNAWNAGHFNCYDGALVVMALANAFGLSSYMKHGSWNGIPHVWAYVNGIGDIDATAIQGGYGLTSPKVSGGVPSRSWTKWASGETNNNNTTTNHGDVTLNIYVQSDSDNPDEVGERIGRVVVDKVGDLLGVNPATGR